jgi:hypothetical protein
MLSPLPRCSKRAQASLRLARLYQPSPVPLPGRPAHLPFRGLLSVYSRYGLHARAVTKSVTAIRGLQTFRLLHACPGCFRLERLPGGACTRWKSAALSRRTWKAEVEPNRMGNDLGRKAVALVEMIGKLGGTFGHGVTYDANLHAKLRRRYQ